MRKAPKCKARICWAFYKNLSVDLSLVAIAAAAGVRYAGLDTAFLGARRVDNPKTGVPATAKEGFAVAVSTVTRNAENVQPSELDSFINRSWYLHGYLDAPGLIRRGERLSRREVIKHMANEMGGVHLERNTSPRRDLLVEAERKLFIEARTGAIRGHYIEVFAIGQAVGRSEDFQKLATTIRSRFPAI